MPKYSDTKKTAIMDYINEFYDRHRTSPTVRDICAGTGIPITTVHRYLGVMRENGELDYNGRKSIGTTRMKKEREHYSIPVLGRVACGPGDYEEENVLEYIRMPETLTGKGEFFALIAKGQSMVDAGISEGDYVVVRKQSEAKPGDLVVALYDGGLNNLKSCATMQRWDATTFIPVTPIRKPTHRSMWTSFRFRAWQSVSRTGWRRSEEQWLRRKKKRKRKQKKTPN